MIRHQQKVKKQKQIPEKLFYKIGEVTRITGVEAYVLRYWETEFPFLKPRKSRSGQRVYVKKDIELINQIRQLLYEERYTIEGVRKRFEEPNLSLVSTKKEEKAPQVSQDQLRQALARIKSGLRGILKQLS
ncbi:MAG: MerR family transcriptional regulator [bacterium]